ncbi:hypothetical protein E5676_scaffold94G00910 [Cucumis melo var. makuwa]|uniref:Uncharacterized protein n=1 Tax=Cucumis melo var. makuwa TaxID=1194695 RepID=A0A5A7U7S7_CUCMM|nr:hypothetical protein E6C27_scaffold163G00660 [Cucumis melo var. makuwa]TYK15969.1 hypothetical protein E5676_scaffold94G00910 [Cucumis melo var. makuwa]
MQDVLANVAWPGTKWDRTPTGKYQLFSHNLNTAVSLWLVFIKKNIIQLATTAPYPWIMFLYCIMIEIPVTIGEIICKHLVAWVKHPR